MEAVKAKTNGIDGRCALIRINGHHRIIRAALRAKVNERNAVIHRNDLSKIVFGFLIHGRAANDCFELHKHLGAHQQRRWGPIHGRKCFIQIVQEVHEIGLNRCCRGKVDRILRRVFRVAPRDGYIQPIKGICIGRTVAVNYRIVKQRRCCFDFLACLQGQLVLYPAHARNNAVNFIGTAKDSQVYRLAFFGDFLRSIVAVNGTECRRRLGFQSVIGIRQRCAATRRGYHVRECQIVQQIVRFLELVNGSLHQHILRVKFCLFKCYCHLSYLLIVV